jgi:hypothetical protein
MLKNQDKASVLKNLVDMTTILNSNFIHAFEYPRNVPEHPPDPVRAPEYHMYRLFPV